MENKIIPEDILKFVNSIPFNDNITENDKQDFMEALYIYRGVEGNATDNLKSKNHFKNCIAYETNKYLCECKDQKITTKYSHVVPRNQLDKILERHNNQVFSLPTTFNDFISGESYFKIDKKIGGFAGFCDKCEELFVRTIDTELNPDIFKIFLSVFRILGKEIRILELFIPIWEKILSGTSENDRKKIKKSGFEILLPNETLDLFIENKKVIYLRTISFFMELKTYWNNKQNQIINANNAKCFAFEKIVISHDLFPVIGQSFGVLPVYHSDVNTTLPLYSSIQYNKDKDMTVFHLFAHFPVLDEIKKDKRLKNMTNKEWAYIICFYSLKNYNNIYFADSFKPTIELCKKIINNLPALKKKSNSTSLFDEMNIILIEIRKYINKKI